RMLSGSPLIWRNARRGSALIPYGEIRRKSARGTSMSAHTQIGWGWMAWLLLAAPLLAQEPPAVLAQTEADVSAAWREAGAEPGWLAQDRRFSAATLRFRREKPSRGPATLAFRWTRWRPGALRGLPEAFAPYGIDLSFTQFKDAD